MSENTLTSLFTGYCQGEPKKLLLLSSRKDDQGVNIPVGVIYTDKVDPLDIIISTTNSDEKYFLYYKGLGIYFTTWRKIN